MNFFENAGAIAGSLSAILALLASVIAYIKRRSSFRKKLMDKLDAITDDIGDLQYERLSQAHDFYTERGWCPTSKKEQLCTMYKSYTSKGRNHLSHTYEQDILQLPTEPFKEEIR